MIAMCFVSFVVLHKNENITQRRKESRHQASDEPWGLRPGRSLPLRLCTFA